MTCGWQSIAGLSLTVGDGSADLGGDLVVQEDGIVTVNVDNQHCASHSSALMVVETLRHTTIEPPLATPAAGVIEEARSRQRRHRRIGVLLLLVVALAGLIASLGSSGGGSRHGGASIAQNSHGLIPGSALRLPRGRTTTTFTISAPAEHAYDVTVRVPAASAIVLTMSLPAVANDRVISPAAGWTVNTLSDSSCHTNAGHADCLLHFAAGGNPGGRWTGIVHKSSIPAARVNISIVFARRAGDLPESAPS